MKNTDTTARHQLRSLIDHSSQDAGMPLSITLKAHLVDVLLRLMTVRINTDKPTIRLFKIKKPGDAIRLGDECLVSCGLFRERTLKIGGPEPYIRAGSSAYDFAGFTEAAYNMRAMVDVLWHIPSTRKDDLTLARQGSQAAMSRLQKAGVFVFPGQH